MADALGSARIALTCSGLGRVRRGVESWTQEAFAALKARGMAVTLFKGSGPDGMPDERVVRCLARGSSSARAVARLCRRVGWRVGLGSVYDVEQTTFALKVLGWVRKDFDLIHTQDPHVAWLLHRARQAGWSRPKVILAHGTDEPAGFLKRLDYIQHLAAPHLEEALEQGVRARRQFAIPNCVDAGRFRPGRDATVRRQLGIPEDAFLILCVAAIKRHHKRVDWLFSEVAQVGQGRRPPVHLLVVGSRTEETASLMEEGRLFLDERVHFLVDQPHERMAQIYQAADLFVLCSLREMLAIAFLEAMASGVPCLGHMTQVIRWVIGPGGDAIDMALPGALAAAIRRYLDPRYRQVRGLAARARAMTVFSQDVVIQQQLAMYREVLEDTEEGVGYGRSSLAPGRQL